MARRTKRSALLFKDAIDVAEHLQLKPGLTAVTRGQGHGQIVAPARALVGSVAMDDDCLRAYPNAARWDYVIGTTRASGDFAYFVEVHSAETSEVSKLEAKLAWLLEFLERDAQLALRALPREIHWVASGRVNIPKTTPQYRKLQTTLRAKGLLGPVKQLTLG